MIRTIIVLAGSIQQYQDFLRANFKLVRLGKVRYIYADFPEKIMGVRANGVEILGNFWQKPNASKLHALAMDRLNYWQKKEEKV